MTDDEIRALSTILFGNADRLRAAAAIGRVMGKPITAKLVAEESGLPYNRAQEQVAHFRRGGLLIPEHDPTSRAKAHRIVALSYWTQAAHLESELRDIEHLQ